MKDKIEELELKHLAPYGDKGCYYMNREKNVIYFDFEDLYDMQQSEFLVEEWRGNYLMILHPLSDLSKHCEDLGFVPIEKLLLLSDDNQNWFDEHKGSRYSNILHKQNGSYAEAYFEFMATKSIKLHTAFVWNWPNWIVNQLHEWHFDTQGLIESGLAIDVNTLETNPYS